MLRDEPDWADRAARFAERVRDVSEFLAEAGPRAERRPVEMKVAYHDACHLAHAQGVREQPRELLRGIPGLELLEPRRVADLLRLGGDLQPGPARAGGRAGRAQGAQPARHGRRGGGRRQTRAARCRSRRTPSGSAAPLPVLHPMELLARSIAC